MNFLLEPQVLATGFNFGESPRWHDGRLWLCNWGTSEIVTLDADGNADIVAEVDTTVPYSIDWLHDGRLLVVSGQEGLLLRQEPDGTMVTHADLTGLARVCNEIVVDGRGNIYVNGGNANPIAGEAEPGFIFHIGPTGDVRRVADDIEFGNGMAVTPDNSTLIVAESYGRRLSAFDIGPDGGLSNRRVWADLGDGVPDGICLDADGAVWYADVPNQRCMLVREGGEVLAIVPVDRGCFACMLGGPDGTTLYIAAAQWGGMDKMGGDRRTGQVLTVTAPTAAAGWP